MSDPKFPILGAGIAPMLGRTKIMHRLWTDLTKATPSNLSIVGPRFVGKTVIMNALEQRVAHDASSYDFVLHWHLGHITPKTDGEFVAQLCDLLRAKLASSGGDYSEHQSYLTKHTFNHLNEVTDLLDTDGKAILMLWDGFDKPLGQGNLSGQLWDQMRAVFYGKKHKIVTATRKPLNELLRTQDAISSPFWNIFDMNSVRVEVFDDGDRDSILGELTTLTFEPGAKTELQNWSSGYPPFYLALLNTIGADNSTGSITNEKVNNSASNALDNVSSLISDLWADCPAPAQDNYSLLMEREEIPIEGVAKEVRVCLIEKGFAKQNGNKLKVACRMLRQYLSDASPDAGSMARLFGTWDSYKSNIRNLLERRLAHIIRFDELLHRLMAHAIEELPGYPDQCLNNLTGIEERALDLIWQREFGPAKVIPQDLIDYWSTQAGPNDKAIKRLQEQGNNNVPPDRTIQCGILQLLTGSKQNIDSRARAVSKDAYVLINAIHTFRNRNQHAAGEEMYVGVAVAAIMTCLELTACLERELVLV